VFLCVKPNGVSSFGFFPRGCPELARDIPENGWIPPTSWAEDKKAVIGPITAFQKADELSPAFKKRRDRGSQRF
jgi:hypothetical protein